MSNPGAPPMPVPTPKTILLVHGAWHDETTWDLVVPLLDAAGVRTRVITLPSTNPGPSLPGLAEDVAAVTCAIEDIDESVVLVGHSYGGMVISAAGHHERVEHLVNLAAFCPAEGEAVVDLAVGTPPPLTARSLRIEDDGTMRIDPEMAIDTFYADVEHHEARRRAASLLPSSSAIFSARSGPPAWMQRPTTYVVCTNDRAISVDREEQMAERATADIVHWPTSHSPFVSDPARVADALASISRTKER
jgi:pimeloyl-ACP methyl ester carboxylesterase